MIKLSNLVKDREFTLPASLTNCRNPKTGEPSVSVGVNGKITYLPTGKIVGIPYEVYCALRDAHLLGDVKDDFDPLCR